MNIVINHSLGAAEAKARLAGILPDLKARFGGMIESLDECWTGNTNAFAFRAKGMDVSGQLAVTDSTATLVAELPMAAFLFKSTIESLLRAEATKLLS